MRVKRPRPILVRRAPSNRSHARIALGHRIRPAARGRSGIRALKREGDGATPLGRFPVREVLYRADRGPRPRTRLPLRAIRDRDGWCEDPAGRNYNRLVKRDLHAGTDALKRDDHLYDLVLVLGYNDRPRVRGKGSAIFIHLAREGFAPTQGCIALSRHDLTMLLARLEPGSTIWILP